MSSKTIKIGPAQVQISTPNGTTLPSASGVGFTATAYATNSAPYFNDIQKPLTVGVSYKVIWAFVGEDTLNGGYTITQSSSAAAGVSVTSGNPSILLNIPAANLPAGAAYTPAIAIFLAAGNGTYALNEFAYLNVSSGLDFNHAIVAQPFLAAPAGFSAATLTSTVTDPTLGSRETSGWTLGPLTPTTGGVSVTRSVDTVNVPPDNSADYPIVTTRTASIEFKLLLNDIINVIQGNAGIYSTYTAANGHTYKEGALSINTAAALISGNAPMILILPPDNLGNSETRLYMGQLLQNQTQNQEDWTKTAITPISFKYNAVAVDTLTNGVHTEISVTID